MNCDHKFLVVFFWLSFRSVPLLVVKSFLPHDGFCASALHDRRAEQRTRAPRDFLTTNVSGRVWILDIGATPGVKSPVKRESEFLTYGDRH
jgi:hypothetical protein